MSTTWRWGKKKSDEIRERIGSLQPSQPTATQSQSDFQLSDKHKQELLDIVEGRDTFSYDAQSDPMYQQYREQYTRNARGAAEDVYANATARSGGFGNSYANVAAQQTYNTQMEGVTDIIPELEALAYGRHQTQQEQKLTAYDQLQALYDADHEELLSRMYLYAYNGTQEGLWDGASGAKEALRAKFPEMTDDDFATIKAEMYDGGYWKGAEKSGAPSGGYTAEDGTVVSEERINEVNDMIDLWQESTGKDALKYPESVRDYLRKEGILDVEIDATLKHIETSNASAELAEITDVQNINRDIIEQAVSGFSDEDFDPTLIGIDVEAWAGMNDEEREAEVMSIAETTTAEGNLSKEYFEEIVRGFIDGQIKDLPRHGEVDELLVIGGIDDIVQYIDDIDKKAMDSKSKDNMRAYLLEEINNRKIIMDIVDYFYDYYGEHWYEVESSLRIPSWLREACDKYGYYY